MKHDKYSSEENYNSYYHTGPILQEIFEAENRIPQSQLNGGEEPCLDHFHNFKLDLNSNYINDYLPVPDHDYSNLMSHDTHNFVLNNTKDHNVDNFFCKMIPSFDLDSNNFNDSLNFMMHNLSKNLESNPPKISKQNLPQDNLYDIDLQGCISKQTISKVPNLWSTINDKRENFDNEFEVRQTCSQLPGPMTREYVPNSDLYYSSPPLKNGTSFDNNLKFNYNADCNPNDINIPTLKNAYYEETINRFDKLSNYRKIPKQIFPKIKENMGYYLNGTNRTAPLPERCKNKIEPPASHWNPPSYIFHSQIQ